MKIKYYTIVEEKQFEEKIDSLRKKYKRIDDVWLGISWLLAREKEYGKLVDDNLKYRIFRTEEFGNTPGFWVLYYVDKKKEEIRLISIEAIKS